MEVGQRPDWFLDQLVKFGLKILWRLVLGLIQIIVKAILSVITHSYLKTINDKFILYFTLKSTLKTLKKSLNFWQGLFMFLTAKRLLWSHFFTNFIWIRLQRTFLLLFGQLCRPKRIRQSFPTYSCGCSLGYKYPQRSLIINTNFSYTFINKTSFGC